MKRRELRESFQKIHSTQAGYISRNLILAIGTLAVAGGIYLGLQAKKRVDQSSNMITTGANSAWDVAKRLAEEDAAPEKTPYYTREEAPVTPMTVPQESLEQKASALVERIPESRVQEQYIPPQPMHEEIAPLPQETIPPLETSIALAEDVADSSRDSLYFALLDEQEINAQSPDYQPLSYLTPDPFGSFFIDSLSARVDVAKHDKPCIAPADTTKEEGVYAELTARDSLWAGLEDQQIQDRPDRSILPLSDQASLITPTMSESMHALFDTAGTPTYSPDLHVATPPADTETIPVSSEIKGPVQQKQPWYASITRIFRKEAPPKDIPVPELAAAEQVPVLAEESVPVLAEESVPVLVPTIEEKVTPEYQKPHVGTIFNLEVNPHDQVGKLLEQRLRQSNVIVQGADVKKVLWGGMIDGEQYAGWVSITLADNGISDAKSMQPGMITIDYGKLPQSMHRFLPDGEPQLAEDIVSIPSGSNASTELSSYLRSHDVKPSRVLYGSGGFIDDVARDNGLLNLENIPAGKQLVIAPQTLSKHIERGRAIAYQESLDEIGMRYAEGEAAYRIADDFAVFGVDDVHKIGLESIAKANANQYAKENRKFNARALNAVGIDAYARIKELYAENGSFAAASRAAEQEFARFGMGCSADTVRRIVRSKD